MRFGWSMLVLALAIVGADIACEAAPECHAVQALVMHRKDRCVFEGAFGSCAPQIDTSSCKTTVCCAQPDDPNTFYGTPCKCPEDLRACTDDETAEYERGAARSCGGAIDAGADASETD